MANDVSLGSGPMFGHLIFDQVLVAAAASFDIQNIPQNFTHLFLLAQLRVDEAVVTSTVTSMRLNNDSGANYDSQYTQANNATTDLAAENGTTSWGIFTCPGSSASANTFAPVEIWLPNYVGANFKNRIQRTAMFGTSGTASTYRLYTTIGQWRSTAAINRITLLNASSKNFVANSRVSLYGMP